MLIIYLWDTVFSFLIMVADGCRDSNVVVEMLFCRVPFERCNKTKFRDFEVYIHCITSENESHCRPKDFITEDAISYILQ